MLAKASVAAGRRGDRRPRGRGRDRGQGGGARARRGRAETRAARPDDGAPRQRTLDAVVGGRPPRGGGGAARRRRTPKGRVPGGRVRRGRAAAGRGSASRRRSRPPAGSSRQNGSPPQGTGSRLSSSVRPTSLPRSAFRCLTIGAGTSDYALARVVVAARASGLQARRRASRTARRRSRPRRLRATRTRPRLRRQVGDPPEPDRAGQLRLHPVARRAGARAKRILDAAAGAARFEGELVDEASRRLAESLLTRADALHGAAPGTPEGLDSRT